MPIAFDVFRIHKVVFQLTNTAIYRQEFAVYVANCPQWRGAEDALTAARKYMSVLGPTQFIWNEQGGQDGEPELGDKLKVDSVELISISETRKILGDHPVIYLEHPYHQEKPIEFPV